MKKPAPVPGACWLKLTKGRWALVDEADFGVVVANGHWHLYTPSKTRTRRTHYARRVRALPNGRRESVYLHRWLWKHWGLSPTEHVDHVDGDGLDCRRDKLRATTHAQNQRNRVTENSTGFVGVKKDGSKFIARITANGMRMGLGRHFAAIYAAVAYDMASHELHGEYARGNGVLV